MNTTRSKLLQAIKTLQENKFEVLCEESNGKKSQKKNAQEKAFSINNSNAQTKKRNTGQCTGHI